MHMRDIVAAATALLATTAVAHPAELEERSGKFEYYKLKTPLVGPCDLTVGPDGALWGQGILANVVFRVDPLTKGVEEFPIPFTTPLGNTTLPGPVGKRLADRITFSCAIRNATDGNLYAGNGVNNQLLRINPKTKAIKVFTPNPNPAGNLFPFNDLYSAADGVYLTQTTGNTFQFFSFATEKFTTYTVPTPLALPLGCYVASDNKVYIAEVLGNKILVFDPATKKIDEVPILVPLQSPAVVRAEQGGWVYFTLFTGNGLGKINMKTHEIQLYHTDQLGNLGSEDTVDRDGGVWLSSFTVNVLSRLDTNTFDYSYLKLPKTFAAAGVNGIPGDVPPYVDVAVNYGPGNAIWFTSLVKNLVGRYSLD